MSRILNIPRSLVYYKKKARVYNTELENAVISIFRDSKNNYGSRKIKIELKKQNILASRRKISLTKVKIFHTDRGNEFKNKIIDKVLEAFKIKRSLSKKGCPYDNAVAEAGYKIIKTEFAFNRVFKNLEELKKKLRSYVLWYNNKRIHSALNYMTPVEYCLAKMTE